MNSQIRRIEELTANAFPALQTELFDGWVLRFSNGFTYRANCISLLYPSHMGDKEKIKICEKKYFSRGLPTVFKLTDDTQPGLDILLEQMGFSLVKTVDLMTYRLAEFTAVRTDGMEISHRIDGEWLDALARLGGVRDEEMRRIQGSILRNIASDFICVKVRRDNTIVGCGLGVFEEGFVGLYDIAVEKKYWGLGIGTEICNAIITASADAGAKQAYLQVYNKNVRAVGLYEKLGFRKFYSYWFREKQAEGCRKIVD